MTNTTTTARPASPRQTFALFCATGKDWRSANLTFDMASAMIGAIAPLRGNKPAALDIANRMVSGETVDIPTAPVEAKPSFAEIYREAHEAGKNAAAACEPVPMIIPGYAPVMGGVCGFAWVRFPDARKPFGKWLVKESKGRRNSYSGGVEIWAGLDIGGQSMAIKEAYCRAFAEVCRKHGIDCYAQSRID